MNRIKKYSKVRDESPSSSSTSSSTTFQKTQTVFISMAENVKQGSRPPWVGLGAAVWLLIASGNSYGFPLYSHSLRSVLGFNQQQIAMLGVAIDIGENVGILPGIASNKLPHWLILSIGAVLSFVGYGVLWLSVSRTIASLPYCLVCKSIIFSFSF